MMEAVRSSETLVNLYQSTRRYNPEGSHLHYYSVLDLLNIRVSVAGNAVLRAVVTKHSERAH
jgi:hypothetical protein